MTNGFSRNIFSEGTYTIGWHHKRLMHGYAKYHVNSRDIREGLWEYGKLKQEDKIQAYDINDSFIA